MKEVLEWIVAIPVGIILAVVIIALIFGLSGLIWWGIGAFIIWAFGINFIWTYWHGLAIAIVLSTLSKIFSTTIKKEN